MTDVTTDGPPPGEGFMDVVRRVLEDPETFKLLYRVAFLIVRNPHDAEELAQEAGLRALKSAPEGVRACEHYRRTGDVSRIRAWLRRIVSNLALDFLRNPRHRRTVAAEDMSHVADAKTAPWLSLETCEELLVQNKRLAAGLAFLRETYPKDLELLLLVHVAGLTPKQISDMESSGGGAVRQRLHRALKRLRIAMGVPEQGGGEVACGR